MPSLRDNGALPGILRRDERGSTLAEILVAIALSLTLLAILYSFSRLHLHNLRSLEKGMEVLARGRAAMVVMTCKIREAGYWPSTGGAPPSGCARIRTAAATQIRVQTDLNGNGACSDANEDTTYTYDANAKIIQRSPGGAAVVTNVEIPAGNAFLTYYGQVSATPLTLPVSDSRIIKRVRISFEVEVDEPTPYGKASGKKVRVALVSDLFFRNSE